MMKVALSLYLLLFGVHFSGCSKGIDGNNAAASGPQSTETASLNSEANPQDTPGPSIKRSRPNSQDVVLFDGKNYIKKSGWKTPSRNATYIFKPYDQGDRIQVTENGKRVMTNTILYGYRPPWLHSQDFSYEGRDLDYLKGKLESLSFMEISANGKVFMYSISVESVVTPSPSNNDHVDPFGYQIQDRDGDGIFETLLGDYDEIVVPNWVLK